MQATYVYQAITGVCLFIGGFGLSMFVNKPEPTPEPPSSVEQRLKRVEELLKLPTPVITPLQPALPNNGNTGAVGSKE